MENTVELNNQHGDSGRILLHNPSDNSGGEKIVDVRMIINGIQH